MSRESTAFGAAIEKLVDSGHTVNLTLKPGYGQNKSTVVVLGEDEAVVAKFTAGSLTEVAELVTAATQEASVVTPSKAAHAVLEYLRGIGSGAQFAALDGDGDLVNLPELDTPIIHRQRAAAIRNGRANGAAVILNLSTFEVSPIEAIAGKAEL